MNVLLVQNHELVGPDMVEETLCRRDVPYVLAKSYSPKPLPAPATFDAVMVFGSTASCRDLEAHAELLKTQDLVAACVGLDKAVLGICFGGQLLAHILGAEVRPNDVGEYGCCQISLTSNGRRSLLFEGFPPTFPMIQYHGETFGIPPAAGLLASSKHCRNQAFVSGRRVGLQFHLEASPQTLSAWIEAYPGGPAKAGKTAEELLAECEQAAGEQSRLCDLFIGNFLKMAAE